MIEREWPPGHRLFSEGDFHLQFDPPRDGESEPALLLKIDAPTNTVTVLRCEVFRSDEAALAWFAAERRKRSH